MSSLVFKFPSQVQQLAFGRYMSDMHRICKVYDVKELIIQSFVELCSTS
jgi:hypothetical protein